MLMYDLSPDRSVGEGYSEKSKKVEGKRTSAKKGYTCKGSKYYSVKVVYVQIGSKPVRSDSCQTSRERLNKIN